MQSEASVERTIRKLLSEPNPTEETYERADDMLEELRAESPLRHRLMQEIDELRKLAVASKG